MRSWFCWGLVTRMSRAAETHSFIPILLAASPLVFAALPRVTKPQQNHQLRRLVNMHIREHQACMQTPLTLQVPNKSYCVCYLLEHREQAWRSAESTRLPPTGLIPGLGVKCGLNLLLVLVLSSRGYSPGTPISRSAKKKHF